MSKRISFNPLWLKPIASKDVHICMYSFPILIYYLNIFKQSLYKRTHAFQFTVLGYEQPAHDCFLFASLTILREMNSTRLEQGYRKMIKKYWCKAAKNKNKKHNWF